MNQLPSAMNRRSVLTTAAGAAIAATSAEVRGSVAASQGHIKQSIVSFFLFKLFKTTPKL